MKKYFLLAAVALFAASCTSDNDMLQDESAVNNPDPTTVTLTFSPYDIEAMTTRAAVADFANKLDLWLYEGTTLLQTIQQESSQTGFGTLSLTLDKRKTYTIHAVAHKCSAGHATLADGIITWPNDKITQSFYYTQTFSPADVTALDCQMQRIVGQFRLETTDQPPADAARVTIDVPQTFTAWSTTANAAATPKDRTVNFSTVTPTSTGTVTLSCYLISTAAAPTTHTVTVTFYDTDDQPLQQRTFEDVPIRNGYRTTYAGLFFKDQAFTATFTVDDWQDYDPVEF